MNEDKDLTETVSDTAEDDKKKNKTIIWEIIQQILIALVLFLILINFVLIPCEVEGTSMYPTLHEGDFGYSFIITKMLGVKRFDIVVISLDDEEDKLLVKRLVGLPNEKIEYIDDKLYVNGEYVEEPFLQDDVHTGDFSIVLSDDEYYCLGDNRTVSRDSRYYGTFRHDQIVSSHVFIIKPFKDMGMRP